MQAFGILISVVFIVPAISSAYIRWKITRTDHRVDQPAASATIDSEITPATLTTVQQPISDHPPDTAGADCDPPAYYSIVGEGDTSQNARVVEEPYYSQTQPGIDPPAATASETDSPQNAYDYPMVPTATGGGVYRMVPIILRLCIWKGLPSLQLQMTKLDMMNHLAMYPSLHDFYNDIIAN